jgi:hypothetical protein
MERVRLFAAAVTAALCPSRGWLRAKRYRCQTKGSSERGRASKCGGRGCVIVSFLGEGGLDVVDFLSLRVITHRLVGRFRVLGLWLGRC